jgi:endonuclease YncB( thermonuclease family)
VIPVPLRRWLPWPTLGVAIVIAAAGCTDDSRRTTRTDAGVDATAGTTAVVAYVTDGDTIRLRDGRRVRFVQIDAPETNNGPECGGAAATAALRGELAVGATVRLVTEPASDEQDRYGRLLRYVYLGDRNLNVWMVRSGNAAPYFYDGERGRFAETLERDARHARAAGRGFWGRCPGAVLEPSRGVDTDPG